MSARELAADPLADDVAPAPPPSRTSRVLGLLSRMNRPVEYGSPTRPVRELLNRRTLLDLVVLLALVTVGIFSIFHLGNLRVPYVYNGDAVGYGSTIRTLLDTGWVQHTPRLGAPFGQDMYDMPLGGDNANYFLMKIMTIFTKDWGLLLNLFYLAGFYLNATSAWFCARLLGCSRLTAICLALLYDFVQFHFWRYPHTLLANYFILPIAVVLAVRAAHGRSYDLRDRSRLLPSLGTFLAAVAAGSFGGYWAIFAAITIGFMCAATAVTMRSFRPALHGVMVSGTVLVALLVNELQSLIYQSDNGPNPLVAQRSASEQDRYGLRLIQLITPTPGGRFDHGALGRITTDLFAGYPTESSEALGMVSAGVFAAMLIWIVIRLFGSSGQGLAPVSAAAVAAAPASLPAGANTEASGDAAQARTEDAAAAAAEEPVTITPQLLAMTSLFWVLLASTGGLEWLIWLGGFHEIRGWGRASILILFMTLAWGGLILSRWQARRSPNWSRRRRIGVSLVIAAVVLFGFLEESPSRFPSGYTQTTASYRSDKSFFAQLESQLPPDTMVFNLPIRRYPEEPATVRSGDYAMLVPFIDTRTLRFSYGGMKGRQSEWQQWLLGTNPSPDQLVQAAAAAGFRAVLIDTFGYRDNGVALSAALRGLLGQPPMTSSDGRWVAFSLASWLTTHPASAALHDLLLKTPLLVYGTCGQSSTDRVCPQSGPLMITTPIATTDQPVTLSVTAPRGPATFSVEQHGSWTTYQIGPTPTQIQLSAGSKTYTDLSFRTTAPASTTTSPSLKLSQIRPTLFPAAAG